MRMHTLLKLMLFKNTSFKTLKIEKFIFPIITVGLVFGGFDIQWESVFKHEKLNSTQIVGWLVICTRYYCVWDYVVFP